MRTVSTCGHFILNCLFLVSVRIRERFLKGSSNKRIGRKPSPAPAEQDPLRPLHGVVRGKEGDSGRGDWGMLGKSASLDLRDGRASAEAEGGEAIGPLVLTWEGGKAQRRKMKEDPGPPHGGMPCTAWFSKAMKTQTLLLRESCVPVRNIWLASPLEKQAIHM